MVALIRGLKLATPVLLGHSMGGMTAAVVASRNAAAVRGLVLADPAFLDAQRQREVYESGLVEQHRRLLGVGEEKLLAQLRLRRPQRSLELLRLQAVARLQTQIEAFDVLTPPHPEYRELISAIRAPIQLVIGDSGVVSLDLARGLQRLNPRLQVEQIEDAGHGIPFDQPDRFVTAVKTFLRAALAA